VIDADAALRDAARDQLLLAHADGHDAWLWNHAERVYHAAQRLRETEDYGRIDLSLQALAAACWFSLAGWAVEVRAGKTPASEVLARPTTAAQRAQAAAVLEAEAGKCLTNEASASAAAVIRACDDRHTSLPAARLLSDAENLCMIGVAEWLRGFRQDQAEGRPLAQLVRRWRRQKEYQYWDVRLRDAFHGDTARQLAQERLAAVDQIVELLAAELPPESLAPHPT
jgi:hypothetical protein